MGHRWGEVAWMRSSYELRHRVVCWRCCSRCGKVVSRERYLDNQRLLAAGGVYPEIAVQRYVRDVENSLIVDVLDATQ
jgi:hypothetical protein